jgi:hypothetical protein
MTYPPSEAAGTTGGAPAGGGNSPYGNGTGPVPTAPPLPGGQPKSPRRRSVVNLAATALVSALIGGGIVAAVDVFVLHDRSSSASKPSAPTSEQIHDANVKLCTSYAISNAALPKPQKSALDVLPVVNAYQLAITANPDASPEIRDAVAAVVEQYEAQMAVFGEVRTRGYSQPPDFKVEDAQAAVNHAWDVCQLGN